MQTILFFSTDKELLKAVGAVELKHCKLILINNIKYIFHNAEEHQPRYVIFDHENDNTGEILKFISAYSDLKVIITAGKKDYHFKNVKTGTVYNNVSLINT